MDIIGTIKLVQPMQAGTSQAGNAYKRQTFVIEYGDRYPKELALTLFNDQCDKYGPYLVAGQQLKFYFDATSREFNGRYYTECMIWKIESLNQQPAPSVQVPQQPTFAPQAPPAAIPPGYPQYPTAAPMAYQVPTAAPPAPNNSNPF